MVSINYLYYLLISYFQTSIDWQPSVLSPSKLSDSQDSACYVDFDDESGDDGFIDDMVYVNNDKVHVHVDINRQMNDYLYNN